MVGMVNMVNISCTSLTLAANDCLARYCVAHDGISHPHSGLSNVPFRTEVGSHMKARRKIHEQTAGRAQQDQRPLHQPTRRIRRQPDTISSHTTKNNKKYKARG